MNKSRDERLAAIEAKLDFVIDNMAYKGVVSILKWSMGGLATLALASLLLAAKAAKGVM